MSNEDIDSTIELKDDELAVHNPKEGPSGDDSGFFLSPQPLTSKLIRCASTPLSDKGLQSLLTLDFDYHSTEGRCRSGSDTFTSNLSSIEEIPDLVRSNSEPLIKHVTLDPDEGHQESQELVLSFKTPDSSSERQTKGQQTDRKIETGAKERVRLLSEDEFRSDSGIGSDFSILSTSETSQCTTPGLTSTPETSSASAISKDRDVFDSKKKKKERGATARPLQRSARFAHIPGIFEGRESLDFICLLSEMGMVHILAEIWRQLSLEDLGRAQQVCATWRACLISDRDAGGRWKDAKEKFLENVDVSLSHPQFKAQLYKASPRKALSSVANILVSPTKFGEVKRSQDQMPPPVVVSPSKIRHKLFADEASRLGPQEQLQQCPRCTMPCRVNRSQSLANCTRISCQFSFCTHCMCASHGDQPCRTPSRTTRSKAGVASKKSRSRLKRL